MLVMEKDICNRFPHLHLQIHSLIEVVPQQYNIVQNSNFRMLVHKFPNVREILALCRLYAVGEDAFHPTLCPSVHCISLGSPNRSPCFTASHTYDF